VAQAPEQAPSVEFSGKRSRPLEFSREKPEEPEEPEEELKISPERDFDILALKSLLSLARSLDLVSLQSADSLVEIYVSHNKNLADSRHFLEDFAAKAQQLAEKTGFSARSNELQEALARSEFDINLAEQDLLRMGQ
jgi:hypothetical protein